MVSARGWLVVNPLGVDEPTVGWKRAPLLAVAITSGVISDKCYIFYLEIYMLACMLIVCAIYEWFEYKTVCVVF